MKKISTLLLQALLLLSMTTLQASVLDVENLNEKITKHQTEQSIEGIIAALEKHYVFPEKALLIEKEFRYKLATKSFGEIPLCQDCCRLN